MSISDPWASMHRQARVYCAWEHGYLQEHRQWNRDDSDGREEPCCIAGGVEFRRFVSP
jgi:hypothetical protein